MSSRQQAKKADKASALEALKFSRLTGKREYKPKEAEAVFDDMDDDEYKRHVKNRLDEDDFVEDDMQGESGYVDQGLDDWDADDRDRDNDADSDEEEEKRKAKKAKKEEKQQARQNAAAQRKKANQARIAQGANPYVNPDKKTTAAKASAPLPEQETNFLDNLMGSLDSKATVAPPTAHHSRPTSHAPVRIASMTNIHTARRTVQPKTTASAASSEPVIGDLALKAPSSDDSPMLPAGKSIHDDFVDYNDYGGDGADESEETARVIEDEDEDMLEHKPLAAVAKPKRAQKRQLVNASVSRPGDAVKAEPVASTSILDAPVEDSKPLIDNKPKPKGMDWRTATAALSAAPTTVSMDVDEEEDEALPAPQSIGRSKHYVPPPIKVANVDALEEDGSLRFWWIDFVEPAPGQLILIGKTKAKSGKDKGKWVSATLQIKGLRRKLYVLPRLRPLDSEGVELDEEGPIVFDDVATNFEYDADDRWKAENIDCGKDFVRKKYCFGVKGVPREETDWLEVTTDFPGKEGNIPMNASGERYSHVFGVNTSAFETFVVDKHVMGPCWLDVKNVVLSPDDNTWTKLEAVADQADVSVMSQDKPDAPKASPPLTVMSLSMRTVLHLGENKKEIVCASLRVWQDLDLDDPKPIEQQPCTTHTWVRPLFTPLPDGFDNAISRPKKLPVTICADEKALLTRMAQFILRFDPDVFVGHGFAADLDVILNRMKDLQVDHWSRIGRLRRPKMPRLVQREMMNFLSGRLVMDLFGDGMKPFVDSVTWSLDEMCSTHLKVERESIDPEETPKYFDQTVSTAEKLLYFVQLCDADTYFQMAIVHKVQALPLTRQLTNLAGNSWTKTVAGSRSDRNEFILLHRFNAEGYICPEKQSRWQRLADEEAAAKKARNAKGEKEPKVTIKKEKFKGGLVFEPKKGLCDRFVLVMDFNSLYPSIMQEYDIDFSTIDWTADDAEDVSKMPDISPCEGDPKGILPQLIASLVERRRNVKRLMKDKGNTAAKMMQYDITQRALKLTANSMYGCLGFEGSRFYARPLAALTTFKGREILTRTKADAEGLSLEVIYGDTDSIFVNTNEATYEAAIKVGTEFKKVINDKYKKLEIETDGVFQRILLLNKKKYAAVKIEEDGSKDIEVKGLDMKRREYSELSKNASKYVLDKIMSGESTEMVVNEIHEYLQRLGEDIRAGKIPLDLFIIHKRLSKEPSQYGDPKGQPHVQVALKMKSKGQSARSGDVIPYIFCVTDEATAGKGKAVNAYHPDDVKRVGSLLRIDYEYYIASQVLPPVERLCSEIEGTEKARLAECLGLDAMRFKTATDAPEREFKTLASLITDAERFADTDPFRIACRKCKVETVLEPPSVSKVSVYSETGLRCVNPECASLLQAASLATQLDVQIRKMISKYYEGWLVCDDSSCANRTRMMSVYGRRCLVDGCRGQMHFEYSDTKLYNQLLYFDNLFDGEKVKGKASTLSLEHVTRLVDAASYELRELRGVVKKYLDKNGRRWVGMGGLFSFMKA